MRTIFHEIQSLDSARNILFQYRNRRQNEYLQTVKLFIYTIDMGVISSIKRLIVTISLSRITDFPIRIKPNTLIDIFVDINNLVYWSVMQILFLGLI